MNIEFPVDVKSLQYIQSIEKDPDIQAILTILLNKKGRDFYNYASIICFCYREEDLINIADVRHLPGKVKSWIKRMSFENDPTYLSFFRHLFSLYSSFKQTYAGWDKLGKYRSIFPEAYIYRMIQNKYARRHGSIVERECFVVIDDWDSRINRTKKEGQKVDIAAWDLVKQSGEVFEVKVKIYIKEKLHQIEFLEKIAEISEGRIKPCLASFAPRDVILQQLRSFFPDKDLSKINILGIEELQNL